MRKIRIICTVTNDLSFDQRIIRTASALSRAGYEVWLVGRELPGSVALNEKIFVQKRLKCLFNKGMLFYAEFNIRLFFFLLFTRFNWVLSVDLDTLMPGVLAGKLKGKKIAYDAHEYFTEVPEVVDRPMVKSIWEGVARIFIPLADVRYTVGPQLAKIFSERYGCAFGVVRNVPESNQQSLQSQPGNLIYQGALNEGRGIEALIVMMKYLPDGYWLNICGEGDLSVQLRNLAQKEGVVHRIKFHGMLLPSELKNITSSAWLGFNLLENKGLSYYYSLANKFFDYVQAGLPQVVIAFPEYLHLNQEHTVALTTEVLDPARLAQRVLELENDPDYWQTLHQNCLLAAKKWNWENEATHLIRLFK